MPGAVIVANQPSGAGAGSPGVARNDLWQGQQVQLVDGAGGNSAWEWTILDKPAGSAVTLSGETTSTATFTPDLTGSYRIQLITNTGGPGNVQIKVFRVRYDNAGVLVNRGWALPALGEVEGENNYPGNTRSWADAFELIFSDMHTAITGVAVPQSRIVGTGDGLVGGGDLSADRVLAVLADPDGSISVGASGLKVGVLASDVQHGALGGGSLHALAVSGGDAGFLSGDDKTNIDNNTNDLAGAGSTGASKLWRRDVSGVAVQRIDAITSSGDAGVQLINTTAADGVTAQVSPALVLSANAWATPGAGSSQRVDWAVVCEPETGEAPGATLKCYLQKNGGGFASKCSISSAGVVGCAGVTATGPVAGTSVTASSYLGVGTAPLCSVGSIRGDLNFVLGVKAADGINDHGLLFTDGADGISIGDGSTTTHAKIQPKAGGYFSIGFPTLGDTWKFANQSLTMDWQNAPTFTHNSISGVGSTAGKDWVFTAQDGQTPSGANNAGGGFKFVLGAATTSGTGTAYPGGFAIQTGAQPVPAYGAIRLSAPRAHPNGWLITTLKYDDSALLPLVSLGSLNDVQWGDGVNTRVNNFYGNWGCRFWANASIVLEFTSSTLLTNYGNTFQFGASVTTPKLQQATPTSDTATQSLTISSQAPYASATTNKSPGNLIFTVPAAVAGGTAGQINFNVGAVGLNITNVTDTYVGFVTSNSTVFYANSPGKLIAFQSLGANNQIQFQTNATSGKIQLEGWKTVITDPTNVNLAAITVVPNGSGATSMNFGSTTIPAIGVDTPLNDTATQNLTINGQSAYGAATINTAGSDVNIGGGGGAGSSGLKGGVALHRGVPGSSSYMVDVRDLSSIGNRKVVALFGGTKITGTQIPSGDQVLWIGNTGTAPSSNPVGGYALYSNGGALTGRGTSGTVTTIGPADPHCPNCGRDYALEWQHDEADEHLAVCVSCLIDEMEAMGSKLGFLIKNKRNPDKAARKALSAQIGVRVAKAHADAAAQQEKHIADEEERLRKLHEDGDASLKQRQDAAHAEWLADQQRQADEKAAREAKEAAFKASKRGQWMEAEKKRIEDQQRALDQERLVKEADGHAEQAARRMAEGDHEGALWTLIDVAERWVRAGDATKAKLALDMARSGADAELAAEIDQEASALGLMSV